MNKFDDSFDDILATMEEPTKVAPTKSNVSPGNAKKSRLSFDSDSGLSDSVLAKIPMPAAASTSAAPQAERVINAPFSAGKTNSVLVNPKQRGNCFVDSIK